MNSDPISMLIHRHLDGMATPEESSRLALALVEDPEVARAYARATRLEAALRGHFEAEAVGRRLAETATEHPLSDGRRHRGAWVAAAAVLAAGLGFWWWRPWGRSAGGDRVVGAPTAEPRRVVDVPGPPPAIRRPGALSPAAREMKRLASRFWLPESLAFSATPLSQAVAEVQQRATSVNHLRNPLIAAFAIDLPEEVAEAPVSATRGNLPLHAWLELLSAQVGCELRYTESGVAFDPVDQPDRIESREFPLPSLADASAPASTRDRLFSYAPPWDAEPDFRSFPAHGASLAAAWEFALPPEAKIQVRTNGFISVRHTRRELRRFEGMVAVATADASRPSVVFRAQEVAMPAATGVAMGQHLALNGIADDFVVDLNLAPEVVHFEGFINYGRPIETTATDANGQTQTVVLTESRIEQPVFATRPAAGNRVVSNDEAAAMLGGGHGRLFGSGAGTQALGYRAGNHEAWFARGYAAGQADADGPYQTSEQLTAKLQALFDQYRVVSSSEGVTFALPSLSVTSVRGENGEVLERNLVTADQPARDPWQSAVTATAGLGESAWLATSGEAPVVTGKEVTLGVGFSLLDLQPPPPLNTTARLEGEMVKLTGTYTPPGGAGAPTDFEAYVAEGQSLVLQTEDAPVVPASGGVVTWDIAGASGWQDDPATAQNGRRDAMGWEFAPQIYSATVRGVVISPVLKWPSSAGK